MILICFSLFLLSFHQLSINGKFSACSHDDFSSFYFTQTEVTKVHKNYEEYTWVVSYHGTGAKDQTDKFVQGNFVFICAGPLGSTKILTQSKTPEFDISNQLGKKFNGNGGLFGMNILSLRLLRCYFGFC